jgi:hypothetical protein
MRIENKRAGEGTENTEKPIPGFSVFSMPSVAG